MYLQQFLKTSLECIASNSVCSVHTANEKNIFMVRDKTIDFPHRIQLIWVETLTKKIHHLNERRWGDDFVLWRVKFRKWYSIRPWWIERIKKERAESGFVNYWQRINFLVDRVSAVRTSVLPTTYVHYVAVVVSCRCLLQALHICCGLRNSSLSMSRWVWKSTGSHIKMKMWCKTRYKNVLRKSEWWMKQTSNKSDTFLRKKRKTGFQPLFTKNEEARLKRIDKNLEWCWMIA